MTREQRIRCSKKARVTRINRIQTSKYSKDILDGWAYASSRNVKKATENAWTPEASLKRKSTWAERGHQQGKKNSQFGTCWINDGIKAIKIKKELLDEYLTKGYSSGRKLMGA